MRRSRGLTLCALLLTGAAPAAQDGAAPSPTARLRADLIRIDTSNPPGNEGQVAEFLAPRFRELGFQVELVPTPEPGKSHFFARLKGDGSKSRRSSSTAASGGNVVPGSAEATINFRTIPGTNVDELIEEVKGVIQDPGIEVTMAGGAQAAAYVAAARKMQPSPEDNELYRAIAAQARAAWPTEEVTPYLFQAVTDAGAWRSRGIPVYGIYPYPLDADDLSPMHGNDERVSVRAVGSSGANFRSPAATMRSGSTTAHPPAPATRTPARPAGSRAAA